MFFHTDRNNQREVFGKGLPLPTLPCAGLRQSCTRRNFKALLAFSLTTRILFKGLMADAADPSPVDGGPPSRGDRCQYLFGPQVCVPVEKLGAYLLHEHSLSKPAGLARSVCRLALVF